MTVLYNIVTDPQNQNTCGSRGVYRGGGGVISYLDRKYVTKRLYVMHEPVDASLHNFLYNL